MTLCVIKHNQQTLVLDHMPASDVGKVTLMLISTDSCVSRRAIIEVQTLVHVTCLRQVVRLFRADVRILLKVQGGQDTHTYRDQTEMF